MNRATTSPVFATALAGALVVGAAILAVPSSFALNVRLETVALAVALALSLQIDIDIAGAHPIAAGNAVAIAYAVLFSIRDVGVLMGVAIVFALPAWAVRAGLGGALRRAAWVAVAAAAAVAAHAGTLHLLTGQWDDEMALVARVAIAGVAFMVIDAGVRAVAGHLVRGGRRPALPALPLRPAMGAHLAVLCAAALLVLSVRELGVAAAFVAAIPILVIHFSFARYARARRTYEQAVRALSVVPDVAGVSRLGHGERTALYASALADEMRIDRAEADLVVTAARIHHIGRILDTGGSAVQMLRDIHFLDGVAGLLGEVESAPASSVSMPAAIIRVASSFDDLTADVSEVPDSTLVDPSIALLERHTEGSERSAAATLVGLCDRRADLIAEAARQGWYHPVSGEPEVLDLRKSDHGEHSYV